MPHRNPLRKTPFFQALPAACCERLWQEGRQEHHKKGHVLIRAREPVTQVWFQLTGKSIIYSLTPEGRRRILFVQGRGSLLTQSVSAGENSSVFCEVLEDGSVFSVPVDRFRQLMAQEPALGLAVLEAQEQKLLRLEHQLKNTSGSVSQERRLASKLWRLAYSFGIPDGAGGAALDLRLSVTFLADLLGTPRETASRACIALERRGLIVRSKKHITIPSLAALSSFYKKNGS